MVMHLIPTEGSVSWLGKVATTSSHFLEGKPAAMFFLLAGIVWGIQHKKRDGHQVNLSYVLRRSSALFVLGAILHVTVWSTEVLTSLGLCFLLASGLNRLGRHGIWMGLLAVVGLTPLVAILGSRWIAQDWLESGEASLNFRTALFDGSYPLFPWLALILIGILVSNYSEVSVKLGGTATGVAILTWTSIPLFNPSEGSIMAISWVPTSLPFLVINGGIALGLVYLSMTMWSKVKDKPAFRALESIGQTSLTHYLGHILLLIVPLRHWYPAEEWPTRVGVIALILYSAFAAYGSRWWLRRYNKGPAETFVSWISGPSRTCNAI